MRKSIRLLSFFIAIVLLFQPIISHAADDQAEIEKTVNGYAKACRNYNLKKAKSYIHMNKKSKFYYIADSTWNKYIKKAQKSFHVEITNIRINGDTAYVNIDYGGLDMYECITSAWRTELHEKGKISTERFKKYVIDEFKYALKHKDDSYFEYFMTIKLTKKKGKWKIDKPSKKIIRLYDGGATEALRDIVNNPLKFY